MDTLSLIPYIYERLALCILIFSRISTLFAVFVLFRRDYVNSRIIISLAAILTFYIVLSGKQHTTYEVFSLPMMMQLGMQIFIGFIAGIILNIVFEAFAAAGQIISTQVGFSMITLIDPKFGMITPLTLFYIYLTTLVFLFLDGHLLLIKLIMDSFNVMPIDQLIFPHNLMFNVLNYAGTIFSGAISLSIILIVSMLLTNLTIAVMTRFAQQFNIFSIGINITIILGLIVLYVTFPVFVDTGTQLLQSGINFLHDHLLRMN